MEQYFDNINKIVIEEINRSEFIILAAVAWITDYKIIEALINKLKSGITIELIINDDDRFIKRKEQFNEFRKNGGKLFLYPNDNKSIMHNKFCTIDLVTTVTGSFNWSFNASTKHKENIIIERNNIETGKVFSKEFSKLKRSSILFESEPQFYDLLEYAEVTSGLIVTFDNVPGLDVIFGNKIGKVYFEPEFLTSKLPTPKKLLGYWKGEIRDHDNQIIRVADKIFCDFECMDPNYMKYIARIIRG